MRTHVTSRSGDSVGRTPWSAAGALACPLELATGRKAGPGGPARTRGCAPQVQEVSCARHWLVLLACLLLPILARAADAPSYAKDVAPIFAANCAGCHGGSNKMGNLSLDTYDGLKQGGHTGAVIIPGKSEE